MGGGHIYPVLFRLRVRALGSLHLYLTVRSHAMREPYSRSDTVGAPPIRIVRIVVVDIATRIDVELVVSVVAIAATEEHIVRRIAYSP